MTNELSPLEARHIIDRVGGNGTPPEYGFQFFTSGIEPYLDTLEAEYLSTFISQGGSAFKMVVGVYGGGKTHFLYCVREIAWKYNFAVSYVSLSASQSPFHRLDLVYKQIVQHLMPPLSPKELLSGYEEGIVSFLRTWFSQKYSESQNRGLPEGALKKELRHNIESIGGVESLSFLRAVKSAFYALLDGHDDDFQNICQWLTAEPYNRMALQPHSILERIDKMTAFIMLRSLAQWIRRIGYNGLIILLDEAEREASLSTKQREQLLSNLRELIDECGHTRFQGVMFFYAVPDEYFLEGRTQIYEALKQRVATVFATLNPSGVKIELEDTVSDPIEFLNEIGQKLAQIYETAYGCKFSANDCQITVNLVAETAYGQRHGDIGYKRLFVQKLVQAFHFLRLRQTVPSVNDLR